MPILYFTAIRSLHYRLLFPKFSGSRNGILAGGLAHINSPQHYYLLLFLKYKTATKLTVITWEERLRIIFSSRSI